MSHQSGTGCHRSLQVTLVIFIYAFLVTASGGCNREFKSSLAPEGTFRSPSDLTASAYGNLTCQYTFQGGISDRVSITFEEFSLVNETNGGCNVVYIDIFAIDVLGQMSLAKRLCGESPPKPYTSVDQLVHLIFKMRSSRYQNRNIGFTGTYKFIGEEYQPFAKSDARCGSTLRTGAGGELTSPGYPEPYPINIDCTWMIRVQQEQKILINFIELSLDESIQCNNTYVSIWNGFASPEIKAADTVCGKLYYYGYEINGDKDSVKEFKSTFFRVVIRFHSQFHKRDHPTAGKGFKLSWTAVTLPGESGSCPYFECEGGEYCLYSDGLLCNPLPKYCIDESLRCNGLVNCGAKDHSDEFGCWTVTFSLLGTFGGIILIAVLTVLFFRHRRRQQQSLTQNPGPNGVYYQSADIKKGHFDPSQMNGTKKTISYSPVKKLSSPGYIAVYSPEKKGFSVFDEYDSETCWNKGRGNDYYIPDEERKALDLYVNHSARAQKSPYSELSHRRDQKGNTNESPMSSEKHKVAMNNSHSMTLISNRKSQYIACPTFPTPPESDPEIDPFVGHTYANVKDSGKKNMYMTMPRVNPNSVSAVV